MSFGVSTPMYFTDPAPLSASVSHGQADAMVAAAAAVWNVSYANVVLAQGGNLSEHISSANSYMGPNGPVFPADVDASNYKQKPIAVIYDTDGSILEMLLGQGASATASCRQNGVIESVDAFGYQGTIDHALIVINGRCAGAAPQQLLQLQYQLARVFGRVLGLAWSQLNDNVFTGARTPTANEMANWPLMHPIDIICGPYTYQCMQNPFTLREDDVSALALLYPVTSANALPGKIPSFTNATGLEGQVNFPSGQGMEQVNVTVLRHYASTSYQQPWQVVSAVSGVTYVQDWGNPVTGPADTDVGARDEWREGAFSTGRVELGATAADLTLVTEPINPLYTGAHAVAPYVRPPVTPSGSPTSTAGNSEQPGGWLDFRITVADAATGSAAPADDGTETSPATPDPSGEWRDGFPAPGHTAWRTLTVRAKRTWTLEATATDENGLATGAKTQPVIGVWQAADAAGTLPTVGATPMAMNALTLGTTQLRLAATTADTAFRIAFADQFGAGRPDFTYGARVLYADSLSPATVGTGGGQITISGMGFRAGNRLLVNGVAAKVVSYTANTIVAIAPSRTGAGSPSQTLDVTVADPATGGSSTIQGALTYSAAANDSIVIVAAPAGLETGVAASPAFTVRVLLPDGTPAANAGVLFAVASGGATLGCGASCLLTTDANGVTMTSITGTAAGTVVVTATEASGGASVQITLTDTDPKRSVSLAGGPHYVAAGASPAYVYVLTATQDGSAAVGVPVSWTASSMSGPAPSLSADRTVTAQDGTTPVTAQVHAIQAKATQAITACAWSTFCASSSIYGIDPALLTLTATSGGSQNVSQTSPLAPVTVAVADPSGHPVESASITIHQTVYAWEGICPAQGRCPAAPVLLSRETTAISDAVGTVQLTPLEVPGVPQMVQITLTTDTQGSLSLTLRRIP